VAFEPLAERLQRSQSRVAGHLAVYIHRHRDLAVAQYLHGHLRVDIKGNEQRCSGLAGGMHRRRRHASPSTPGLESAVEVSRIDRLAKFGRDHQTRLVPSLSLGSESPLEFEPTLQSANADFGKRQGRIGCRRLGLPPKQAARDAVVVRRSGPRGLQDQLLTKQGRVFFLAGAREQASTRTPRRTGRSRPVQIRGKSGPPPQSKPEFGEPLERAP
jgi:hypothetical protein